MKAAQVSSAYQIELNDVPEPTINSQHDVLLQVQLVGICGSDIHYYRTGRIGNQVVNSAHTIGHETSAVVMETGNEVTRFRFGDRVTLDPSVSCGRCDQCISGRPHTCRNNQFLGCPGQLPGSLSRYLVMPESCCFLIPEGVSEETAVLSEPLSIGLYAVQQALPLNNAKIAILGAGPIGLSVLIAARFYGALDIYVSDRLDYRCEIARKHGARWAGNPYKQDVVQHVRDEVPSLLDTIFECSGQQEAMDQALQLVKPGGTIQLIGIPEFDRYSFDAHLARRHEINLKNIRRQNGCTQLALDMIAEKKIDPTFMITHHFSLSQIRDAFELLKDYKDGVIKAVILCDR